MGRPDPDKARSGLPAVDDGAPPVGAHGPKPRHCSEGVFKYAFQQGYLASERLYGWKLPKMGRAQVYMPTTGEVAIIIAAIEGTGPPKKPPLPLPGGVRPHLL